MATNSPPPDKPFGALVAVVGLSAAAILVPLVQHWEGTAYKPYRDVANVLTVCTGDTYDVENRTYTKAECEQRLERQLIAHARPVLKCTPSLENRPNALAAASSLAYNIGVSAYCRSTVARRFNAGDIAGACDGFLAWRFAAGREIKGLLNRRKAERKICLRDAP